MMLTMVESLVRSEGGIGVRLLNENRLFNLEMVLAIQLLILGVGLGLDYALGVVRRMACPYAYLVTERR
jgi:NitT/TauT family transport system permease protein